MGGLEVSIDGAATLKRVAAQMRAEGRKDLSRSMAKALAQAAEPVKAAITRETVAAMPSEGGYKALISGSLRHRMSRRAAGQQAQVIILTYADATSERRDIVALNKGILRHPVFGRSRKIRSGVKAGTIISNAWAVTSIRGGFHQRGTANALDAAQNAMIDVVEDYAHRLVE